MVYFLLSILFLALGHFARICRWELFVKIYEKPNLKSLLLSFSAGSLLNMLVPYRLGEIVRAIAAGRNMKNGIVFSFATVVMDRYLDIIIVGFIYFFLFIKKLAEKSVVYSLLFYSTISFGLLLLVIIIANKKNIAKKTIKKITSIFNTKIEFYILFFFWSFIAMFKNIIKRMNALNLMVLTVLSWGSYLISYKTFANFLNSIKISFSFEDVISFLFSAGNYNIPVVLFFTRGDGVNFYFFFWSFVSLLCLFSISLLTRNNKTESVYSILLPYINEQDQINFLEAYFSAENTENMANLNEINKDIYILHDLSSGSNATTLLCSSENGIFYRKYCFGKDSKKLKEQVEWIETHSKQISIAEVISKNIHPKDIYCCYDMKYNPLSVNYFNYIHSEPLEKSKSMLSSIIDDLGKTIHSEVQENSLIMLDDYIKKKAIKNLDIITSSKELKGIIAYEELIINGKVYKNIPALKRYLSFDYLYELFKNDKVAVIHGDLTVENIICVQAEKAEPYYLIDPNTGNIHESPFMDYAKILQSLHGGYEFFMKTDEIKIVENRINFTSIISHQYKSLFDFYVSNLRRMFAYEAQRSIFFHEIIHWLRLLPYKLAISQKTGLLFYTAFIIVLNDVVEWYGK